MFGRKRGTAAKENAAAAAELAAQLAADRTFRKQLLAAVGHGARARRRAAGQLGFTAAAMRLASDEQLRRELRRMIGDLQAARARLERKRSHRMRNSLLVVGASGAGLAVAALAWPASRRWVGRTVGVASPDGLRAVEATIEVEVPVSTAYNQWTQFEQFPEFMDGVESVRQLDDARLHWVANVAGRRAEWEARILEQHPDRQISWISEYGRTTRGTVTFEPLGEARTLVRLSMSYRTEGLRDAVGATIGIDRRQVQGDLTRFKELIEQRGHESGAWRGEVSVAGSQ
jgi:uncharacterized membrane protein